MYEGKKSRQRKKEDILSVGYTLKISNRRELVLKVVLQSNDDEKIM